MPTGRPHAMFGIIRALVSTVNVEIYSRDFLSAR
jgi:hypothetical protein